MNELDTRRCLGLIYSTVPIFTDLLSMYDINVLFDAFDQTLSENTLSASASAIASASASARASESASDEEVRLEFKKLLKQYLSQDICNDFNDRLKVVVKFLSKSNEYESLEKFHDDFFNLLEDQLYFVFSNIIPTLKEGDLSSDTFLSKVIKLVNDAPPVGAGGKISLREIYLKLVKKKTEMLNIYDETQSYEYNRNLMAQWLGEYSKKWIDRAKKLKIIRIENIANKYITEFLGKVKNNIEIQQSQSYNAIMDAQTGVRDSTANRCRCGGTFYSHSKQTRALDERSTIYYVCNRCGQSK